jgi:hypothetical protein
MSQIGPGSSPTSPGSPDDPGDSPSGSPATLLRAGRVWGVALAAGLAAGLLAWAAGEAAHGAFRPRTFQVEIMGQTSIEPTVGTQNAADYKNAALAFAFLGGATGLLLGLAGGIVSGGPVRGLLVGSLGLLAGTLVGALASLAILRIHYRGFVPNPNDLVTPILIHGGIWTVIGAVGGAAFALGAGLRRHATSAAAGACLGAMLATLLFHVLGESFLPGSSYAEPLAATPTARLLARVLVPLLAAAGAARELLRASSRRLPQQTA